MQPTNFYYIIYDEYSISICTIFDDVCDAIAGGAALYGYTDNEEIAHNLMSECFLGLEQGNL
ncbi:hypothetical protein [Paenibacillus cremeus]|uniref:Uncharacterized protein n=1 Tax=Paenibacillus cremeus TaxID=2163881 RepID=A0A559KAZ5_9BACL|nr:hypothetical protein [Paenibacillus cremeus]TVY09269.1 hypothetical protein FPZ49_13850 [Paenibacillus cremeus]